MLLFAVAEPYKDAGDAYFAKACSFALTAVFFFAVSLKFDILTDAMDAMLSKQLRHTFEVDIQLVTIGMCGSILVALLLAAAMAAKQIVDAARLPTIRLQSTKAVPDLPLAKEHKWHLFLSQCACDSNHALTPPGINRGWRVVAASGARGRTSARRSSGSSCSYYRVRRSSWM